VSGHKNRGSLRGNDGVDLKRKNGSSSESDQSKTCSGKVTKDIHGSTGGTEKNGSKRESRWKKETKKRPSLVVQKGDPSLSQTLKRTRGGTRQETAQGERHHTDIFSGRHKGKIGINGKRNRKENKRVTVSVKPRGERFDSHQRDHSLLQNRQ